jgi:glycerophosphoryl diester phosphodiesterase
MLAYGEVACENKPRCGVVDLEPVVAGHGVRAAVRLGDLVGFFDGERPRLFGHRGAAAILPENTLPAFARAVADGARYLELDVHATADGEIVVIHDATVDRTTEGTGLVNGFALDGLRRLDAGYRFTTGGGVYPARGRGITVPTLAEVLDAWPAVPLNVEIKQIEPSIVDRVVDLVVAHGATARVLLASARDEVMPELRRACAEYAIPTSFAAGEVAEFVGRVTDGRLEGYRPPGRALQVPPDWHGIALITPATVGAAHSLGVEVHAWTINDAGEMIRLLDLGVDGIMTDDPALGRRTMTARA